jgi:two-component system chemotaxis response regulator CheB
MAHCDRCSAGGIPALQTVLASLPATIPASIVVVQHRVPKPESMLERILARSAKMSVTTAKPDDLIQPGRVYLARPDQHLTIRSDWRFTYIQGTPVRFVRSSADPLLDSAARVFGERTIAVVLTGSGLDATDGVQAVRARGGIVIAQDPATAEYASLPMSAIRTGAVDHVVPLEAIAPALVAITLGRSVEHERAL